MPEIEVKNLKNEVVEQMNLADEVYGVNFNEHLIWEAIQHYRASTRKGSASTKTRAEVSGSGRKLWRQKGTGRARMGSIRSPLWRHGGSAHGPKPRNYGYRFPKKKLRSAMKSALSAKLAESKLMVLVDLEGVEPKTKMVKEMLDALAGPCKMLIVDTAESRNFSLGVRNLPHVDFVRSESVNIYDVASHDRILLSKSAALRLQEVLSR